MHLERKARLPSTQCLRSIGERSVAVSDVLKLSAIAGPCIPACGSQRSRSKRPSCQSLPSCFASPAARGIMLPHCSSFRTATPTAVSTSGSSDAPLRSALALAATPADLQLVCLGPPLTQCSDPATAGAAASCREELGSPAEPGNVEGSSTAHGQGFSRLQGPTVRQSPPGSISVDLLWLPVETASTTGSEDAA